jgi:hydrogenase maturation protease
LTAPILVFGWGNPSRGDDALGPFFVDRIAARNFPGVECLTDFQLQVEHALDLAQRKVVLFVDASVSVAAHHEISRLTPTRDKLINSHAITPEAVIRVYEDLHHQEPPACYLLAIKGVSFELGADLSHGAREALDAACSWFELWLPDRLGMSTFSGDPS